MSEFKEIEQSLYEKIKSKIPENFKALADYIFRQRVCTVGSLLEKFPEVADSEMEMISAIGRVNGKIFGKDKCAIYPTEASSTISESSYAFGHLDSGE